MQIIASDKPNRDRREGADPAGTVAVGSPGADRAVRSAAEPQQAVRPERRRRRLFSIYKPGQGRYTRLGTVGGAAVVGLAGASYLYDKLSVIRDANVGWTLWVQAGVPVVALGLMALLVYWLVGAKAGACDFLIATEGEMKKVNWSTRREVVGSTKVVITLVLILAVVLFVVDAIFTVFFSSLGVLKILGVKELLGLG
jgi:preprotein translocase SecE subunit